MPGLLFPNSLYAKLNYALPYSIVDVAANSNVNLFILGNGLNPTGGFESGGIGNFPTNTTGTAAIIAGQPLWQGLQAYVNIYERMHVLSHKTILKFTMDSLAGASTNFNCQILASAYPLASTTTLNDLAALDTTVLAEQKGQQRRMLNGAGGRNFTTIKMARSSKKMLGLKDYVDAAGSYCVLNKGCTVSGPDAINNPASSQQWFFHVRISNINTSPISLTWSMYDTCNVKFSRRGLWTGCTSAAAAPPGSS